MSTAQSTAVATPLLELVDVQKAFPNGTLALRGVSLQVATGSVHGLIGANGAGKSTLIKIVAGVQPASGGAVLWDGTAQDWRTPGDARAAGVAANYQHVPLVPTLSVIENVFLGRRGAWRRSRHLRPEFEALLERVGYDIDAAAMVGDLPIGPRQMVAILQAIATGARLVILDEPTASLAYHEREIVFATVRRLSKAGTSFLYVSHFLDEILDLTDHVTVLRDGRVVLDTPTKEIDESRLVRAIVGRELLSVERAAPVEERQSAEVLRVIGLSSPIGLRNITFAVHAGEIVGLAGLLGSGRSEILQAVFGADPRATGDVQVDGRSVRRGTPAAVRAGIALVPEDRTAQGLFGALPLWQNVSVTDLPQLSRAGVMPRVGAERSRAQDAVRDLAIRTKDIDTSPSDLSGGNAQKVVFGKWLYGDSRVWLLDEPTAGIDVGAKADILVLARRFAAEGRAVVVVNSELEELLAFCTRILVVREGRLVAERVVTDTDESELLMLINGLGDTSRQEHPPHGV